MYRVTYHTSASFEPGNETVSNKVLEILLEGLVRVNETLMRSRLFPDLYKTAVRYRQEPIGDENWRDASIVLESGFGDCEDLAAYRVAELRVKHNMSAQCVFRWKTLEINTRDGPRRVKLYHILVGLWRGGKLFIEDPSKRLGMPSSAPEQTMT